ncbi:MAG TPA: ABC transporter substrate-binding protein, partial [Solirubrobacterales bacterium]|nr:ABC transporter substrate-binding protein [Solirubrobacterales bacterium]
MKRPLAPIAAVAALLAIAFCLSACGASSGGREGGTLRVTYASFPDYLDPALSYDTESYTAMYNTYIPLLTYAHADGEAGSRVIPGLARALPKVTDGGRTYTLFLRQGLRYSDGTPVRASDFTHSVERMLKL